jgi:hypothetical protein
MQSQTKACITKLSCVNKTENRAQKLVLVPFSGKEAPNLVAPLDQAISQSPGTIKTVNLLRYTPENKSSPRVVTGKWLLKN